MSEGLSPETAAVGGLACLSLVNRFVWSSATGFSCRGHLCLVVEAGPLEEDVLGPLIWTQGVMVAGPLAGRRPEVPKTP